MKKISVIALILASLMVFCACGKDGGKDETKPAEDGTTAPQTEKAEDVVIDFATVRVVDFVYAYAGGEKVELHGGEAALKSSKPSVATVDADGKIVPHAKGVTLVGYEKDGAAVAVAVCVFAEGEKPDRSSGGSAEVVEIGGTYMHAAPIGGAQYTSSNEGAVSVANAPTLAFVGSGYACITCASASRPFSYSFIVYDRTVES